MEVAGHNIAAVASSNLAVPEEALAEEPRVVARAELAEAKTAVPSLDQGWKGKSTCYLLSVE